MSVVEKDKVDGIGKSKDNKKIVLMIADHLNWENEYEHLITLQEKINSYIFFIESGQASKMYSNINEYIIKIYFKMKPSENCKKFIESINNQIKPNGIYVEIDWEEDEQA